MTTGTLTRTTARWRDGAAIIVIAAFFLFTSQWWSGLDTPDSEFYASLAIFTDQVTDRAPENSYYWTRLGYIAPVHALISLFGVWVGFAVYKAVLLLIITASFFTIARRETSYWIAVWLTIAAVSSSVMLAYLGNPYLTGSVLAGTSAILALGMVRRTWSTALSGIVLGWLAMVYPSGALLAGSLWVAFFIYTARTDRPPARSQLRTVALTAVTALITIIAFIVVGTLLFPGLSWLGTYIEWSSFDHSIYSSGESVWLRDISLLVPLMALVIAIGNRMRVRESAAADRAVIISATSIGFFLTYAVVHGEQFLEAPMLQAMLWPPALIAVVLVGASRMRDTITGVTCILIPIGGLVIIIVAGAFDPNLPFLLGLMLAIALSAIVIAAPIQTLATFITLTVLFTGAQLLQNSRTPIGQFPLDPYVWAYQDNPNETKLRTAVDSQQWLIDNTESTDSILLWVDGPWPEGDRELYTVASMQLWGENLLTLSPTMTDQPTIDRLNTIRPSVIAMYGKSMQAVINFWSTIPGNLQPTAPVCYDYTWPIDPVSKFPTTTGHTCLTRLTW